MFLSVSILILIFSITGDTAHIGLFASTGCYSHDVMMRKFADRLISPNGGGHRVTVIQIRVYEFDRAVTTASTNVTWQNLFYDARSNESMTALRQLQRQMWISLVPFDADLLDTSGMAVLTKVHNHQIDACSMALRDRKFMDEVAELKLDVLVTDYVLNECALHFTNVLNVNLAYLSNYPVLSSYVTDLGIPSNPSFVPSVIGYDASHMAFRRRGMNLISHSFLWASRRFFDFDARQMYKMVLKNRSPANPNRLVLAFSTPFEMLLDSPRPVARNLHYFGCDHCFDKKKAGPGRSVAEILNITIQRDGVILVSFGTVTKGDQVPPSQLRRLVMTFAQFSTYTFVWQLDLLFDHFQRLVLDPISTPMPSNVHLFPWIPLKRLLADPIVRLSINHGGISTCSEALHHGIPVFGIALQGDQGYNLRRIVDKGAGEMIPISSLAELGPKLSKMLGRISEYKIAAKKIRKMVREYKRLYNGSVSTFWVGWTARHFGHNRDTPNKALRAERFLILRYPANWFVYYSLDVLLGFAVLIVLVVFFFWCSWKITMRLTTRRVRCRRGSFVKVNGHQ